MQSYIAAPQIHANAVMNPRMSGGPFIDYGGKRVREIQALFDQTVAHRSYLLELSKALEDLDRLLELQANGESMHRLYELVPKPLRGYVELFYDLNNHPSYRLIEPLLYRSEFHNTDGQGLVLSQITGDDRPFVLSTPRLSDRSVVPVQLPFGDGAIDYLFSAKIEPKPLNEVLDRCRIPARYCPVVERFFTTEKPKRYSRYGGEGMRWRYFGHACILLETPRLSFLFDPVLSYTYDSSISRYTYDDLPDKIDYVLITHNHQDHLLFETMLQLRHKIECVIVPRNGAGLLHDPSLKLILEAIGFKNVIELDEMQNVKFDGGYLTSLPFLGEHADLSVRTKLAYLVVLGGHKLVFAADSCNIEPELYRHLYREIKDVRALFVGMECDGAPLSWLYGPLLTRPLERAQDQSRRLNGSNFEQAIDIVNTLKCKEVFVYAMGQEPWLNYIMSIKYTAESNPIIQSNKLIEACRQRGITAERLFGEREMLLD